MTRTWLALALAGWLVSAPAPQWVASWTASVQGPYPSGNPTAQPDLRFAIPSADTGARDQTLRLVVRPAVWGSRTRLRFSNVFGTAPVTFDAVFVGLQASGAAIVRGTNQAVKFHGSFTVTVPPGQSVWTDAVDLPFAKNADSDMWFGRKLAVSLHIAGASGPMTWHAKGLTTSYITLPGSGSKGSLEDDGSFPFTTTSWFFLDAVDMMAPAGTRAIVAFGDSITDGTASTLNGDDRWPDVLGRRLHAADGNRTSVVNAGIGGNQVIGPAQYSARQPNAGGPSAGDRLERDVLGLSGVSAVIWLEGINDFSRTANASPDAVIAGMKAIVDRIHARRPGVRVIGATLTSALGSSNAAHGSPEEDVKRQALNEFIRHGGVFDGVADFDAATLDSRTGSLREEFVPDSSTGGAGDKLHPNRAGYLAMGMSIDLGLLMPPR